MTEEQAFDLLLASYQAEVEYRHREYIDDKETRKNISHLARFLTSDTSKFAVMFCGTCGNGKTTLLYALRSAVNLVVSYGMFGSYNESKDMFIYIRDARELAEKVKDYEKFRTLKELKLLAIEDMGREATEVVDYGNVLNPVIDLLEYRYDSQLFTAITTNLTSEQIVDKYGKRIADRFNEMLEVIVFTNPTFRK